MSWRRITRSAKYHAEEHKNLKYEFPEMEEIIEYLGKVFSVSDQQRKNIVRAFKLKEINKILESLKNEKNKSGKSGHKT